MSFRQFIYYCSLCGACAAYVGWITGRLVSFDDSVPLAAFRGLLIGLYVAMILSLIDALWNLSSPLKLELVSRLGVSVCVGAIGGFLGGGIGQILYRRFQMPFFLVLGWTATGLLIGASVSVFELLRQTMRDEDLGGARRKLLNGILGGTAGGLLGGMSFLLLQSLWAGILRSNPDDLWSPGATGFVVLGLCIGLMIGLAQVILREAWIRVEAGFRPGRQLILLKPETTIGRAEGCDIALFGDAGVEKLHARILRTEGMFVLEDAGSATGTYVNGQRIDKSRALRSGDEIRLGSSVLRFGEREKRGDAIRAAGIGSTVGQ